MNFDLRFYLLRFLRRFHYFLLVAVAIAAAGLTTAAVLPPVYRAEARLLVESPQIPNEMAASTVSTAAPEALQIIQQRILTRANLLDMAERLRIYPDRGALTPDKIVEDIRRRIVITLPDSRAAAAFVSVSFEAPAAGLSAQVTTDIVTQILQENVALRTATAGQTLDFFQQEVDRLGSELSQQGARILEFKLQNKEALPDSMDYRRARQASQQERLLQLQRELASLGERRARMVEMYETTGQLDSETAPISPEEAQLRKLQDDLATALIVYSPQNPQVKLLQGKIALLEATVQAQRENRAPDAAGLSAFDLQISDLDSQIGFATEEKLAIEAELATLQASIDATPNNSIALDALQRDYDNIQTQYNAAVARLAQASTGDRIEALSKGQRITVVEQAVVPGDPTSPNRPMIAAGGVFGGIGLGIAFVMLLEVMNRTIHRPVDLNKRLGIAAFATVPFIRTRGEVIRRRWVISLLLLAVVAGIPAALFAVHSYYLPLDLLIARVLDRI
jgi:succinoglycan biosynthesis transport protein ExoP